MALVYTVATVGSIMGGWLPKRLIGSGMAPFAARKRPCSSSPWCRCRCWRPHTWGLNTWYAVGVIALACAAHQAWSANIFTTVSDMFPKSTVASVTGIGGMAGAIGGILIAGRRACCCSAIPSRVAPEEGYAILFMICGSAYPGPGW